MLDDLPLAGCGPGGAHPRFQGGKAPFGLGIEAPGHVPLKIRQITHGMGGIFRHEAVAPPLEDQHAPTGKILYELVGPAVLQDLFREGGNEGSLAPAQLPQLMDGRPVETA